MVAFVPNTTSTSLATGAVDFPQSCADLSCVSNAGGWWQEEENKGFMGCQPTVTCSITHSSDQSQATILLILLCPGTEPRGQNQFPPLGRDLFGVL